MAAIILIVYVCCSPDVLCFDFLLVLSLTVNDVFSRDHARTRGRALFSAPYTVSPGETETNHGFTITSGGACEQTQYKEPVYTLRH